MKRNLLLLSLLVFFSACESQMGTVVSSGISNMFTSSKFDINSSNEAYKVMKANSINTAKMDASSPTSGCVNVNDLIPLNSSDSKNMSKIKDKLCTCVAWGTCDSKSCSCDNLCPKDFKIIKKLAAPSDAEENTLSFTNKINKFAEKDSSYKGYCWGISLLSERFHRLAEYEPNAPKKFQGAGQDSQRIAEYKRIIAQINNNEPVTIPGFKSLRDFSTDPEVKDLLQDSVKALWAENALSSQGIGSITSTQSPSKTEFNQLADDIDFRLKNNMSPAIVYNDKNDRTDAHVLLVSATGTFPSGERYLCLNDNAYLQKNVQNCNIKMIMKSDGTLIRKYGEADKRQDGTPIQHLQVGKVQMTHSENTNLMEQVSNLQAKCAGQKGCPKTL